MTIGPGIIPGFSYLCRRKNINWIKNCFPGCVGKCGPDSFLPALADFKPISGRFPSRWTTGRPDAKRPVNRKYRENKLAYQFRGVGNLIATIKNYGKIFGN